jgi:hypothetical protein
MPAGHNPITSFARSRKVPPFLVEMGALARIVV